MLKPNPQYDGIRRFLGTPGYDGVHVLIKATPEGSLTP